MRAVAVEEGKGKGIEDTDKIACWFSLQGFLL